MLFRSTRGYGRAGHRAARVAGGLRRVLGARSDRARARRDRVVLVSKGQRRRARRPLRRGRRRGGADAKRRLRYGRDDGHRRKENDDDDDDDDQPQSRHSQSGPARQERPAVLARRVRADRWRLLQRSRHHGPVRRRRRFDRLVDRKTSTP